MTLAKIAYYLVDMGSVTTAIAFVLLVAHTSLLAFGRRAVIGLAPATAGAGAGPSGGTTSVTVDRSTNSGGAETAAYLALLAGLLAVLAIAAYFEERRTYDPPRCSP